MEERTRRIGLNEAVFRRVNEEIEALAQRFQLTDHVLDLICECGDARCADRIQVPRHEYVELRADSRTFAVVAGHEAPDVEEVVRRHRGYDVVRKKEGGPAEIAEATDPRR